MRIADFIMKRKILIIILALVGILIGVGIAYVADYYHVTDKEKALADFDSDNKLVKVTKTDFGYAFDGPGEENALVFYPGAKVEDLAYADLLKRIAADGTDCYLVHMPLNFAFLGMNKADKIMSEYDYEHWYLAGHSLGGAMAAVYAEKNAEKLDGLIFLAAYSTKDLSKSGLKILSVYGSEDKVVNMDKIEQGRKLMPDTYEEIRVDGANHAGFGDYGKQSGDGEASISADEQKAETADKIIKMIIAPTNEDEGAA